MMKQCFIVIWARGFRLLSLCTEAGMVSQENQASLMPAKLLSFSFQTLSLPWLSLFLFVSLSITAPLICSLSLVSSAASFSLFSSPSPSSSSLSCLLSLSSPPVESRIVAAREFEERSTVRLRQPSTRRGAKQSCFYKSPKTSAFRRSTSLSGSSLTSFIPHKHCPI